MEVRPADARCWSCFEACEGAEAVSVCEGLYVAKEEEEEEEMGGGGGGGGSS